MPRAIRRVFLRATFLALVCNFAVPMGYMPAALADGGPIKLCPSGWPLTVKLSHAAGGKHSDGGDSWEHCAYGAASSSPALAAGEHKIALPRIKDTPIGRGQSLQIGRRAISGFQSRAPPMTTPALR